MTDNQFQNVLNKSIVYKPVWTKLSMMMIKDVNYAHDLIALTFSDLQDIVIFSFGLGIHGDNKYVFLYKAREIYELDERHVGELSKVLINNNFATSLEACELIENFRSMGGR